MNKGDLTLTYNDFIEQKHYYKAGSLEITEEFEAC